mmetsp:Transcript_35881/g.95265  ORF Transcript_35881/g.95265 Transcript_35881/m.95265 type:complete len:262 (+) Transcript_35881:545-1330(+)
MRLTIACADMSRHEVFDALDAQVCGTEFAFPREDDRVREDEGILAHATLQVTQQHITISEMVREVRKSLHHLVALSSKTSVTVECVVLPVNHGLNEAFLAHAITVAGLRPYVRPVQINSLTDGSSLAVVEAGYQPTRDVHHLDVSLEETVLEHIASFEHLHDARVSQTWTRGVLPLMYHAKVAAGERTRIEVTGRGVIEGIHLVHLFEILGLSVLCKLLHTFFRGQGRIVRINVHDDRIDGGITHLPVLLWPLHIHVHGGH